MKLLTPILLLTSGSLAFGVVSTYTPDANTLHLWHFDEALVTPNNSSSRLYPVDVVDSNFRLDDGYYDATYQSGIMGGTGYTGFGGAGQLDHPGGNGLNGHHYEFRRGNNAFGTPPGGLAPNTSITATELLGSPSGAFTIDGMIKWNGSASGYIFETGDDGGITTRLVMNDAGSANPTFTLRLPNGPTLFTTTSGLIPTLTTTDWYHFAVTFDGNNAGGSDLEFYWTKVEETATQANLVQTFSSTATGAYAVGGSFQVGNWNSSNFDGLVDEFRISNVVRTENQFIFSATGGYFPWAGINVGHDFPHVDTNNDGVLNGVAYFMDQPGLITLPGVVTAMNGTKSVTWPNAGKIPHTQYNANSGEWFVVETSIDLQSWEPVASLDANLSNQSGSISYTLTGSAPLFVRLKVIIP